MSSSAADREVSKPRQNEASRSAVALTRALHRTVTIILVGLALILAANLWLQYDTYHAALGFVREGMSARELNATVVLAKAWDFAVVKTCSLLLAFTLIFVGALYVLRQGEQAYEASLDAGAIKTTLQSSSPGLVLATLGVALVAAALFATSTIQIEQSLVSQSPGAQERGATTDAR